MFSSESYHNLDKSGNESIVALKRANPQRPVANNRLGANLYGDPKQSKHDSGLLDVYFTASGCGDC
jgi:hypothetical protein